MLLTTITSFGMLLGKGLRVSMLQASERIVSMLVETKQGSAPVDH